MSDLKLFRIDEGTATELQGAATPLEKDLQKVVEANMETLFAVRFLKSEHSTGARHNGRIDSLGIDENYSPVIFEYKRRTNENVINQGLFYLDWLMDHKAEFEQLVQRSPHHELAESIDWRRPRLICVANGFTTYDEYAVQQINRSIDLVRYRDFGGELLALELVHTAKNEPATSTDAPTVPVPNAPADGESAAVAGGGSPYKTVTEYIAQASPELVTLYEEVADYCEGLGEDVARKTVKNYVAFRRLKNFACVEVKPQAGHVLVYLKVNPDTVELQDGFIRDVRNVGHFGTGDLEVRVSRPEQLEQVYPLIQRSYENS